MMIAVTFFHLNAKQATTSPFLKYFLTHVIQVGYYSLRVGPMPISSSLPLEVVDSLCYFDMDGSVVTRHSVEYYHTSTGAI